MKHFPPAVACRMKQGSGLSESAVNPVVRSAPAPTLLVQLEPWPNAFLRNLADLFWPRRPSPLRLSSPPAPFWPDVFVASRLPWRRFLESAVYHVLVAAAVWGSSQLWLAPSHIALRPVFSSADIIYPTSEYLPPLNTGGRPPRVAKKGQPAFARQPIISVPPEPDNRSQTIVTPPRIKLNHEVPLPNIVAWSQTQVAVPLAATARSAAELKLPALPPAVVTPPPEVHRASVRRAPSAPQPAIVEPPPSVQTSSLRTLGDVNIGHAEVVAPAPQLPLAEQRTLASISQATLGTASAAVVPPPPSLASTGTSDVGGRLIALSIHPAPPTSPAIEVPLGNRRGTFAATPEGKPDAPGTPDTAAGDSRATEETLGTDHGNGNGAGPGNRASGIPPGLLVGAGPNPADSSTVAGHAPAESTHGGSPFSLRSSSRLLADATLPRVTSVPRQHTVSDDLPTDAEKKVFGARKFYSMVLNMPNLNSAGGSWVIHFAELRENTDKGELIAPVATQKVDPAYPIELMRQNVEGTVTLYAVIHSDGSVADVRILRGVDGRLDAYARTALAQWHFRPATRNGTAVAIEAVVMIPFRAIRHSSF